MGQGLYNMLGLGVLNPPFLADDDENEELYEAVIDLGVNRQYECDEEFLAVRLAVDDEWLQRRWKVPPLSDDVLRCAPRRARCADDVQFKIPEDARKRWQKAQKEFKRRGLLLPDARLIVVNDWD